MTTETTSPPSANRLYHCLMSACGAIAALTFGLMSVLVTADVILRNLNIDFIPASVEITEYMLMIATFIAAPWLLYLSAHIRVDVLTNLMPLPVQRLLNIVCDLIGLIVCGILTQQSLMVLFDAHQQGSVVFKELIFPEWWLSVPLLIGAALLSLEFARRLTLDLRTKV